MGKTANLELNTTEMSDKISDFVGEYNSNMNMLDDLYGDVQENASSALSTAQSAETKATAAQTAATNAVTTANSANTTAQSAVSTANSANTTAGQANTKADNAVATANTAKDTADEAKETAETASADVADKADVDGTYDSFTAGGAKQLLSTVYVDDNEPYNFRTAGGSADIGDRMYEEVVGGTVVWNQYVDNGDFSNGATGWSARLGTLSVSDGVATVTANGSTSSDNRAGITGGGGNAPKYDANHVVLLSVEVNSEIAADIELTVAGASVGKIRNQRAAAGVWTTCADIFKYSSGGFIFRPYILASNTTFEDGQTIEFKNIVAFDLTQMFGSTIADYIRTLEQGTAGAGVAWFRNFFPKPYYEYNVGELMSVKAGSHDTVGFNAWDEEWEVGGYNVSDGTKRVSTANVRCKNKIPVLPNTNYYHYFGSGTMNAILYYDANENYLGSAYAVGITYSQVKRTPNNAYFMTFQMGEVYGATYKHDVCINLSWDGERNGEYEPYEKHTYPLAELELRGIPKLDANNQLYYDGDTYASDGTVTRKYGIVDLGTLTWQTRSTGSSNVALSTSIPLPYKSTPPSEPSTTKPPLIAEKYTVVRNTTGYSLESDGADAFDIGIYGYQSSSVNQTIYAVVPVSTTPTGYLLYELAEPTTETADTYVNPQVVDDFGTEEYVDYAVEAGDRDVAIPVGHNSQYMNNLRAKLEMAPDSPSGDGKYIVQQSNGENAYIPYTADGRLDAIEAKLPAPPSANGTYRLTAVVSNNGVRYAWES